VGPDPIPEPIVEPAPDVSGGDGGGGGGSPEFIIEPSCITEPDECFLPRVLAEDETTD
jgi:hypothetical protein